MQISGVTGSGKMQGSGQTAISGAGSQIAISGVTGSASCAKMTEPVSSAAMDTAAVRFG